MKKTLCMLAMVGLFLGDAVAQTQTTKTEKTTTSTDATASATTKKTTKKTTRRKKKPVVKTKAVHQSTTTETKTY